MAFLVLFVSCEQYDDDIFNDSIKTNQVTGKELFKSIFFGYGSIGGQISILEKKSSSIKRFSKEETQEFEKNMETLLTEIELNSPDFFNFFELKIVSNNHQLIEEAIYEGTKEIVDNIHVIIPNFNEIVSTVEDDIKQGRIEINDNDDIERYAAQLENSKYDDLLDKNMISSKGQMVCTWVLACALAVALYAAVAVHNTLAVAANIYLVFALWGPKLSKPVFISPNDTLREEMLIQEIANIEW